MRFGTSLANRVFWEPAAEACLCPRSAGRHPLTAFCTPAAHWRTLSSPARPWPASGPSSLPRWARAPNREVVPIRNAGECCDLAVAGHKYMSQSIVWLIDNRCSAPVHVRHFRTWPADPVLDTGRIERLHIWIAGCSARWPAALLMWHVNALLQRRLHIS